MNWPWQELGLSGPCSLSEIRRAYAARLQTVRPEADPEGFQRLHSAYQEACGLVRRGVSRSGEPETGPIEQESQARQARRTAPWDYARLLAEGEAEDRGLRFQRAMDLRRKNRRRWRQWNRPQSPAGMAEAWIAADLALVDLELLDAMGADLPTWRQYLKSGVFLRAKDNPDFLFALEAFLMDRPEFPREIRRAFLCAYGLDQNPAPKSLRPLLRLLDREKTDWRKRVLRRIGALLMAVGLCLLALAARLFNPWEEQVCEWMEADFGQSFRTVERGFFESRFAPVADSSLTFLAKLDGPRQLDSHRRGYRSNYSNALLVRAVETYAKAFQYGLTVDSGGLSQPEGCYIEMPLTGAGEGISALGRVLDALEQESWYQEDPPSFELFLCWKGWCFSYYNSTEGEPFHADADRIFYEQQLGPELCRLLAEQLADADMGANTWRLYPQPQRLEVDGEAFFHVLAAQEPPDSRPLYHYLLSLDGGSLFCVPAERMGSGLSRQDLYGTKPEILRAKEFSDGVAVYHVGTGNGTNKENVREAGYHSGLPILSHAVPALLR